MKKVAADAQTFTSRECRKSAGRVSGKHIDSWRAGRDPPESLRTPQTHVCVQTVMHTMTEATLHHTLLAMLRYLFSKTCSKKEYAAKLCRIRCVTNDMFRHTHKIAPSRHGIAKGNSHRQHTSSCSIRFVAHTDAPTEP